MTGQRTVSLDTLGVIGNGSIGGLVLEACENRQLTFAGIVVLTRTPRAGMESRVRRLGGSVVHEISGLIGARPNVVLEAAGHEAGREYGAAVLEAGADLVVMSIGALVDDALMNALKMAASRRSARIWLPSGAVGGLDALMAARATGDLERVQHQMIKHPDGLRSAPYVVRHGLLSEEIADRVVVYRGMAREAAREFPQSVNVAAAISFAGLGFDRTEVEVIADPSTPYTVHQITASGLFGRMMMRFENIPDPTNPRTSRLAGLSAIAMLQGRGEVVQLL